LGCRGVCDALVRLPPLGPGLVTVCAARQAAKAASRERWLALPASGPP
jgi:transposase